MTDFKDELFEGNDLFKGIDKVDILVGIPSYNNAHSIEKVVMTSAEGLDMYYPQHKSIIINSDGQSQDNTVSIFKKARVPKGIGKRSCQYSGDFGKGSALRAIFEAARILDAKVCVVLMRIPGVSPVTGYTALSALFSSSVMDLSPLTMSGTNMMRP